MDKKIRKCHAEMKQIFKHLEHFGSLGQDTAKVKAAVTVVVYEIPSDYVDNVYELLAFVYVLYKAVEKEAIEDVYNRCLMASLQEYLDVLMEKVNDAYDTEFIQ